jgi:hypothetical protein
MKFISLKLVHTNQRETLFQVLCARGNALTGEMSYLRIAAATIRCQSLIFCA